METHTLPRCCNNIAQINKEILEPTFTLYATVQGKNAVNAATPPWPVIAILQTVFERRAYIRIRPNGRPAEKQVEGFVDIGVALAECTKVCSFFRYTERNSALLDRKFASFFSVTKPSKVCPLAVSLLYP